MFNFIVQWALWESLFTYKFTNPERWSQYMSTINAFYVVIVASKYIISPEYTNIYPILTNLIAYLATDFSHMIYFNYGDVLIRFHHIITICLILLGFSLPSIFHHYIARVLMFETPIIFLNNHHLFFKDSPNSFLGRLNGILTTLSYLGFRLVNGIDLAYDYHTDLKHELIPYMDYRHIFLISSMFNLLILLQIYWSYKLVRLAIKLLIKA
jgi:hypothetical protein